MIIRTWGCLNRRCRNEWTADGDHPPCPKCGALKVKWIPGGFHVAKKSPGYDKTIRSITERAGMTNMNDPAAGERAAPRPKVAAAAKFQDITVGGYGGKVGLDAAGRPVPTCMPNGMSDTMTIATGGKFRDGGVAVPVRQGDRLVNAPLRGPTPKVVARHKGAS
jgi:hypothetical protein